MTCFVRYVALEKVSRVLRTMIEGTDGELFVQACLEFASASYHPKLRAMCLRFLVSSFPFRR